MSDILEELKNRRSIRWYEEKPVPEELLDKIAEAGLYAPSGMGRQAVRILVITDDKTVRTLGKINGQIMGKEGFDAFYGAPAVLCVLADRDNPTGIYDGSSAITNMLAEAASLGLGSCWINQLKSLNADPDINGYLISLGMDPQERVYGALALGYAATEDGLPNHEPGQRKGNPVTIII